ncbi:MAG: TRAP transporter small permease subunit [SAR324 cluster bacterium]|nr:TRAP transporter small permease subunit [SAR324 cluster bacterium]
MKLLPLINQALDQILCKVLAFMFAGMIVTVFVQVVARNVLQEPFIWTLDIAQLLFSWCIFLGAALALRWDAHYNVDIVPRQWVLLGSVFRVIAHLASIVVITVLAVYGSIFTELGLTRFAPALGISEFWFFLPIPLGGIFMMFFLAEIIPNDFQEIWNLHRKDPT